MPCSISVIIPARNSGAYLPMCLDALRRSALYPLEIIVVDDASTEELGSESLSGVQVLRTERNRGPAYARNLGAAAARGAILLFLDSDVCVAPDTLLHIERSFAAEPALDGLIGAYDSSPASPDFLSQYRNLMHAYVHSQGARRASTFWSGCGAIRRDLFYKHSGFNQSFSRPAIEDIELGYRLRQANCRIDLDPELQVTHLKRWTFWGLLKTDILDRGIPWTELILTHRNMPDDLNLQLSQRVSVALVVLLVCMAAVLAIQSGIYILVPPLLLTFLMLAAWWSEVFVSPRPLAAYTWLLTMLVLVIGVACAYGMYALTLPLVLCVPVLLLRHRYSQTPGIDRLMRPAGIAYIGFTILAAAKYVWVPHHLVFGCLALVAVTALLNTQFYVFLAAKRGLVFTLAAIPFHFLYHFYNGLSFASGVVLHLVHRTCDKVLHPRSTDAGTSAFPAQRETDRAIFSDQTLTDIQPVSVEEQ